MRFHPSGPCLTDEFRRLCGQHFGITESQIVEVMQSRHGPRLNTMTARMPDYHKLLLGGKAQMQYHLAGYGVYREEALIRLLGESIERYALITAAAGVRKKLFKASYEDLKSERNVLPWEFIRIFSDEDYERMRGKIIFRPITQRDRISWMWCPSLFRQGEDVCVPAQCLFTGLQLEDEIPFVSAFSKGCASHATPKLALRSALLEAVEADALMVRWYAAKKSRRVVIDDPTLEGMIAEIFRDTDVEVLPCEYTLDGMPGHVFGVAVLNRRTERPAVLLGTGSGLAPGASLYRALVEAVAIHYIAYNGPVLQPRDYLSGIALQDHINLDSNVAYWASAEDGEGKRAFIRNMVDGDVRLSRLEDEQTAIDDELEHILRKLRRVSSFGVRLDITPPELQDMGWSVARVFLPELVQVSLPSFPYSAHPRLLRFGGCSNRLPHPAP